MTLKEAEEHTGLRFDEWRDLSSEYLISGGTIEGFRKAMALSESVEKAYEDELEVRLQPRRPTRDTPVLIPDTSPTRYVSFLFALNLELPGEFTGDWHFNMVYFGYKQPYYAHLAGTGTKVDTTRSLESKGVRDMAQVLDRRKVKPQNGPVNVPDIGKTVAGFSGKPPRRGFRSTYSVF